LGLKASVKKLLFHLSLKSNSLGELSYIWRNRVPIIRRIGNGEGLLGEFDTGIGNREDVVAVDGGT